MDEKYISKTQEISTVLLDESKYQNLFKEYASIRRIRGDGNCFYRAFAFGCLEAVKSSSGAQKFREAVMRGPAELLSAGFDESAFKHLFDTFVNVLERCEAEDNHSTLFELFNEQSTSDSVVQYLRYLTSAYLQNHSDFFQQFVEAPSLKVYCTQEVETMAMECDHVEIVALSEALGVGIRIVSMEGCNGDLNHITIPTGTEPILHFLYKHSHYDILYQVAQS
ncbi:ubiquitin thioesterase OTUB2-like [Scleropages formosus]|uniref:ubiquitinyl hydrolase 1 n=1 Tax=Scleropages formosus TaxID=113540 RepID=A0A8C9S2T2_SCLFO|nr:ubiquitin thioesterase OTUB2 [Scleropages formosus]